MFDIGQLLYTLKQEYGFPLAAYRRNPDTVNLETGRQTIVEEKLAVRKGIVLPVSIFGKLYKHAGNPDFNYGGDLGIQERVFIIDRRDLRGEELTDEDYIVYKRKRYSIDLLKGFEDAQCYYLLGKAVEGTEVAEQISVSVQSWLYPTDMASPTYEAEASSTVEVDHLAEVVP